MRLARFFGLWRNSSGPARAVLATAIVLSANLPAVAQPKPKRAPVPQAWATQPAEARYWLRVTADRVNVRSRADLNSRIVGHVDRDDVLEAVGREYGWHRIVPPAGVYSLVSAGYVERVGPERGIVRVNTTLRVRVGSDIQPRDPMVSEVQTRLPPNAEVEIVGALDDGWLKIVPPPGVYVYVSDDFVAQISAEVAQRLRAARATVTSRPSSMAAGRTRPVTQRAATSRPGEPPELAGQWGRQLEQVLLAVQSEGRKPEVEQSWGTVLPRLRPIAAQRQEPQVAKLAAAWIEKIEQRMQEQAALRAGRGIARPAEHDAARHARELEEIRRQKEGLATRPTFDARGVLRPSFALPAGPYGLRYRLQDPFTHEVQAYVELPPELGIDVRACLGKYVGVRGEKQPAKGAGAALLRVKHMTVLNPDGPTTRPAREKP